MSRGKYSLAFKHWPEGYILKYNCYGKLPPEASKFPEIEVFVDYDEEGYDWYGYSAFDNDGNFVGHGNGVDRDGYTEMDYLTYEDQGGIRPYQIS